MNGKSGGILEDFFLGGGEYKKLVYLGKADTYMQLQKCMNRLNHGHAQLDFLDIVSVYDELAEKIEQNEYQRMLVRKADNFTGNRLLWECGCLEDLVIIDGDDPYAAESVRTKIMNKRLWDYIATNAHTKIEAGGWYSSYDNQPFSEAEMQEYADNVFRKLYRYLDKKKTALEIGCASGITMFRLAPFLKEYIGTDISMQTLKKIENTKEENIVLLKCAADEIQCIQPRTVDIVILNSVVQYFPGINYLKQVIDQACGLLNDQGIIYIGDVMDLDKKKLLLHSLEEYKRAHPEAKTKTDFSEELFLGRNYFVYLKKISPYIEDVEIADKMSVIKNELTDYRYDVILHINKTRDADVPRENEFEGKRQYAVNILEKG